jgi:L-ribulose-5-phosphate 3-epimerase
MNLGVRAHDFGRLPAGELGRRIRAHGFTCVQLAPAKALAEFAAPGGRLTPEFAASAREALAAAGVRIAVLGCYINPVDPDPARRREQLERFKDHLRMARHFGCRVVGTETGSLNADFSFHPANRGEAAFQTLLTGVRELAAVAEAEDAWVGIEGVERYVISDARRLRRLLDAVGSDHVQVIFDPVNLLSPENHVRQDDIIREAFDVLGDRIVVLHAKDFVPEAGGLRPVLAGLGRLNYGLVMELVRERRPEIDILMEDTDPATVDQGVRFLRGFFPAAGATA